MQIHSVQDQTIAGQIEKLKQNQIKVKAVAPFQDPIREFATASRTEGLVRGWLTLPIEERKRIVRDNFIFVAPGIGDEDRGIKPETQTAFKARQLERWRGLCVIIQEESRAEAGNRSPEVAIAALKHLFPEHNWKTSSPTTPSAIPPKG